MKKQGQKLMACGLAAAMLLGTGSALAAQSQVQAARDSSVKVTVDGKKVELKDVKGNPVDPIIVDGTTYLPVRAVSEANGLKVNWDAGGSEVKLVTKDAAAPVKLADKIDKSTQPRIIITTDLEVDDINGVLLSLMYATDYDLAGIVWTAGMFHFNGDGEHTLAEVTPNYKCEATTAGGTVENAGQLTSFRPVDPGLLTRLIEVNYATDYQYLSKNDPNYPTPEYLLSIAKTGNIAFEGDYRFETEGSELIEACILDDDPRPLYIMHWGGINTTVRALMSIYEDYHNTDQWGAVLAKVVDKVRFIGSGEDNCRADSRIDELFPGLKDSEWTGFGNYGQYFSAAQAAEELLPYYQGEYLTQAFKFGHGQLMGAFHLMNDGQVLYGEPLIYQYGLLNYVDWGGAGKEGWGPQALSDFPRVELDQFDWMCCQFGCGSFIDIGLRQGVKNSNNHYVQVLFDELAARADWAVCAPEDCNHAPVVSADKPDCTAKAGETVTLSGCATDPDSDKLNVSWWVPGNACTYQDGEAAGLKVSGADTWSAQFTVPQDAESGDIFVVNMEVTDEAERPMTRFAQFIITVTK